MRLRLLLATWNCENQAPAKGDADWDGFVAGLSGGVRNLHKNCDFIFIGLQETARMSTSPDRYVSHKLVEDIPNAVHIGHRSIQGQTKMGGGGYLGGNQRQQLGVIDCQKGRWEVAGAVSAKRQMGKMSEKGAISFALDIQPVGTRVFRTHEREHYNAATRRLVVSSSHFDAGSPENQEADALATEIFIRNCIRLPTAPLTGVGTHQMGSLQTKVGGLRMDRTDWARKTDEDLRTGNRNTAGLAFLMGDLNYRISVLRVANAIKRRYKRVRMVTSGKGPFKKTRQKTTWEFRKADLAAAICNPADRDTLFQELDGFRGSRLDRNWTFPKPTRMYASPNVAFPSYKRKYSSRSKYTDLENMLTGASLEDKVEAARKVYAPLKDDDEDLVAWKSKRLAWDFGWLDRIGYRQFGPRDYTITEVKVWEGVKAFLSDHVPTFMYIEVDYPTRRPMPQLPPPDLPQ